MPYGCPTCGSSNPQKLPVLYSAGTSALKAGAVVPTAKNRRQYSAPVSIQNDLGERFRPMKPACMILAVMCVLFHGLARADDPVSQQDLDALAHAQKNLKEAIEAPPIPTSYRLYRLCEIQDETCVPILRRLFAMALAGRPQCSNNQPLSDDQMYWSFMQMTTGTPDFLAYPAPTLIQGVLNVAEPCVLKKSQGPIYTTPLNMIPPRGSAPGY